MSLGAISWRGVRNVALVAVLGSAAACGSSPVDVVAIDPSSLKGDLVAHWTFDDGAGTQATDSSGNAHHGVLTGGTWKSDGNFGGSLYLASGDFVSVENFPDATASWTVSVWTKTSDADLAAQTTDPSTLIGAETVFAGGWQMHLDNRPGFKQFDAAYWSGPEQMDYVVDYCGSDVGVNGCIEADRWIHLTAVWDADIATMTLYHDDVAVDQRPMPTPIKPGDSTLLIGTWNMKNRFLVGAIDDFAIWKRALRPPEIASLARQPPG